MTGPLRRRDVRLIVAAVGVSALGDILLWVPLTLHLQEMTDSGFAGRSTDFTRRAAGVLERAGPSPTRCRVQVRSPKADIRQCMENRVERVVLETDRHRIIGDLTLPREGYRSRLSDFLNRGDLDFIPLVNAEIASLNGGSPDATGVRSFIAVARTHVQLAYPYEEGT